MFKIFVKATIFAVPTAITFLDVVGQVCRVEGNSMKPLINGTKETTNFVFLSRLGHQKYEFQRGQVVCLVSPTQPSQKLLKRIIALEGDTVKTLNYRDDYVTIPKGHCWVEGDNHNHSLDSNIFGPVPVGLISSKATHIVWPTKNFKRIPVEDVTSRIQKHEDPKCVSPTNFDITPTEQRYFIPSVRSSTGSDKSR